LPGGSREGVRTEEEIAAARFLFSELTAPERPLQDEILTEQEKSDAIADLFGDLCTITQQPRNRIKRSAAPSISKEVSILLLQMKKEIELMPNKDKQAWLEVSRKARESEIDGRRQELFLRREDMDPTRAARRWVTYWEERRRFFGPEKFCLPMTLHGAMRDDHVAMETGFGRILPGLDESGRQMSLVIMRKHTRDGYSTDSMVRYRNLSNKLLIWALFSVLTLSSVTYVGSLRVLPPRGSMPASQCCQRRCKIPLVQGKYYV
jgi:hypothetical protein